MKQQCRKQQQQTRRGKGRDKIKMKKMISICHRFPSSYCYFLLPMLLLLPARLISINTIPILLWVVTEEVPIAKSFQGVKYISYYPPRSRNKNIESKKQYFGGAATTRIGIKGSKRYRHRDDHHFAHTLRATTIITKTTTRMLVKASSSNCNDKEKEVVKKKYQTNHEVESIIVERKKKKKANTAKIGKRGKVKKKIPKEKNEPELELELLPLYWRNKADDIIISDDGTKTKSTTYIRFTIRGNPKPLIRHRGARGFVYNPSAPAQNSFREIVREVLSFLSQQLSAMKKDEAEKIDLLDDSLTDFTTNDNIQAIIDDQQKNNSNYNIDLGVLPLPIFDSQQPLIMSILFRMKRPNYHFINSKRGPERIKEVYKNDVSVKVSRSDVDNLAKFVLDACNGIMYDDDKQIISLHVTKVLDNVDLCLGSTEMCCRLVAPPGIEGDNNSTNLLSTLLAQSFDL